jgi:integrase
MILLAYRHGLRAAELVDLRWEQIDFTAATLHPRRSWRNAPKLASRAGAAGRPKYGPSRTTESMHSIRCDSYFPASKLTMHLPSRTDTIDCYMVAVTACAPLSGLGWNSSEGFAPRRMRSTKVAARRKLSTWPGP